MAKPNKTRYALMGFLSLQDASGYDIKKSMEQTTNHFWRESDSSIYPILKQLLDEGMVSCKIANADTEKPKKIYSLTEDGYREFLDWLSEDPALEQKRDELLLKVFFGSKTDNTISINHIKKLQSHALTLDKNYKTIEKNLPPVEKMSHELFYQYLTLKAGLAYSEARLKWCDEAIRLLERKALSVAELKKKKRKK